jgi:hypothetical protein
MKAPKRNPNPKTAEQIEAEQKAIEDVMTPEEKMIRCLDINNRVMLEMVAMNNILIEDLKTVK